MVNKMPKYEYKIIHLPKSLTKSETILKELANDMWELVLIFNANPKEFLDMDERGNPLEYVLKDSTLFATFKREI